MRNFGLLTIIFLTSCVGPYTPMGPLNILTPKIQIEKNFAPTPENITLIPKEIFLHREMRYFIKARHELAKEFNNHSWKIFYKGNDVSSFFELSTHSTKNETIIESKEEFKLPYFPNLKNTSDLVIEINAIGQNKVFFWPTPSCSVFYDEKEGRQNNLRSMGKFQEKADIFTRLERAAKDNNINPNFYAGLLATVSQLNSMKISDNQKVGLAQIPFKEAILISKKKLHWQNSKRIESSPSFLLRLFLYFALIDPETDWRLNTEKSLLAGAEYLKSINAFWATSEFAELSKNSPEVYSKIVVASYILGPNEVKDLYIKYGEKFEHLKSLIKIKEQIDTAFSYCSEFSSEKNELYAQDGQ